MNVNLYNGDCLDLLKEFPDNSIDAIVTDPPYGISFMGKKWDYQIPSIEIWKECLRVLKPGGHILVACGTKTQHRMAVNIEDAGFEIRDLIAWIYGSGFPKSLDIGKTIQKYQGIELEDTGIISSISRPNVTEDLYKSGKVGKNFTLKNVTTSEAKQWDGWGTGLKPAMELWTLARKPLTEKTVAENVLKYRTGGLNISECRIGTEILPEQKAAQSKLGTFERFNMVTPERIGRWPANLIHDGSDEVLELFPDNKSFKSKENYKGIKGSQNIFKGTYGLNTGQLYNDSGSTARFFYCAKASSSEREDGLKNLEIAEENLQGLDTRGRTLEREDGSKSLVDRWQPNPRVNNHPTVKPVTLMKYLCRLITPPNGTVLDPFMGSGSTGVAANQEGFNFIGIEKEEKYFKIAEARINKKSNNNLL